MAEDRNFDYAVYKIPRKDNNGKDISNDKIGSGGRHRDDGTYSGVAYDPEMLDEDAERRLSGNVQYEDISLGGKILVDGFSIAFNKLMDYASQSIIEGFDKCLLERRRKKGSERRVKIREGHQQSTKKPIRTTNKAERIQSTKKV